MTAIVTRDACRICGSTEDHSGLGGSMIAAALGYSKWNTPIDAYLILRGLTEVTQTAVMEEGHYLEEPLLRWYVEKHDPSATIVSRGEFFRHPEFPWLCGHTDARLQNDHEDNWLADAKSVSWRAKDAWGAEGSDDIPFDAFWQGQSYLFIDHGIRGEEGAHRIDFVARLAAWPPKVFTLPWDAEVFPLVLPKLEEFMWHVQQGIPPAPDFSDDKTLSAIKELFPPKPEKAEPVALPEAVAIGEKPVRLAELAEAYELLGKIEKETGARRKRVEAALRAALGDSQSGTVDEIKIARTFVKGSHVEAFDKAPYDYLRLTFPKTYERKVTAARVTALLAEGEHQ